MTDANPPEPSTRIAPQFNWIVPLRRVVIKAEVRYRDLMWRWLELVAPHRVRHPDVAEPEDADDSGLGDAEYILALWYGLDPEHHHGEYRRAIARLRRWWHLTFLEARVSSSPVGTTTCELGGPNFHARLWKGPRRILLEQAAGEDENALAQIQPFEIVDGRIETHCLDDGTVPDIQLYPGDVLEMPLHVLLAEYGLDEFADLEFDPVGSFYLGTSVRSASGKPRKEIPRLHDNMLAMRYQLVHALNMANCYHDERVYTDEMKFGHNIRPEGAGLYARGMPFAGNPSIGCDGVGSYDPAWKVGTINTPEPTEDRPICMPTYDALGGFPPDLPFTWSWTCSPFAHFFFSFISDVHTTNTGLQLPSSFIKSWLAQSLAISGEGGKSSERKNTDYLDDVRNKQDELGDPLLVHQLTAGDVDTPRMTTPLADVCSFVFPGDRPVPPRPPFSPPAPDRFRALDVPAPGAVDDYEWDNIAPDAGLICVSSAKGHEFCLVRLFAASKLFEDARRSLADGATSLERPLAGHLAAYNPLSGEEVSLNEGRGQFFVTEASAEMPPSNRHWYKPLQLTEVNPHHFWTLDPDQKKNSRKRKFKDYPDRPEGAATDDPALASRRVQFAMLNHKKDKAREAPSLRIDVGEDFRDRRVSSIIYIVHGGEGSDNPRHLTNIYAYPREAWLPIWLRTAMNNEPRHVRDVLRNLDMLYGERAVPFPTILEVADGFASGARVYEQLEKHRDRLQWLGTPGADAVLEAELAAATRGKSHLQSDLKMTDVSDSRRQELRKDLLDLIQP